MKAGSIRVKINLPQKILLSIIFLSVFVLNSKMLFAQVEESYISTEKSENCLGLFASGKASPLFISSRDYPGVIRALKDLQADIGKVTGTLPSLSIDTFPDSKEIVIAGTLGKNSVIDKLIKDKKFGAHELEGKWETFIIELIENPVPGVDRALVIAGSDKRGTIFGIYDLAEKIGVSPWYWWADVPVKKKNEIYVLPGRYTIGEPKVRYRGIFINDEAPALMGWAREKFGDLNHKFYVNVFELILRLKGNYLWPAMWDNNFSDDDSLNPKLADEYGIVMAASHHEPMMRSWKEWPKYGKGAWNYKTNETVLKDYWRMGIERMNSYESVVTLGMRGDGDEAMSESANIELLEKIISDQRKIITEVTGKDAETVPQVWALYKEVQEYYDKGMRVPDDVTLLLCDDNWGNIRKLPYLPAGMQGLNEQQRKGGYGIYYHFDYVGGPRNYKWINTNQIERVWEQMHLAYEYGADRIWVVNVGDIKPVEFPIDFFLDYAWDPEKWTAERLPGYYQLWAEEQFGKDNSKEIGNIISKYTKYNARRKPELLSPETYSLIHYREAERIAEEYNILSEKAERIYDSISLEYKDAFYQLVLHPVIASANLNELYVAVAKNHLYAEQERADANLMAEKVKELFNKDAEITYYYNNILAGGRWKHMMDQTHIGYTYWQQPDSNIMPEIKEIDIPDDPSMGVAVEGSGKWFPDEGGYLTLPQFDKFNQQTYYIEIFNRGKFPFEYSIKASEPWVLVSRSTGKIQTQERLWISIDWNEVPAGELKFALEIKGSEGSYISIHSSVNNEISPGIDEIEGFVESNGYVSIESEHFTNAVGMDSIRWQKIPNLGRTLSGTAPFPVTAPVQKIKDDSPRLEYKVYLFTSGELKVNAYFSPTLNFHNKPEGIRYAISFDDEQPQIINITSNPNYANLDRDSKWGKWVAENINIQVSKHKIEKPGAHVLKFHMIDPGVVLQKIVIDAGGVKSTYLGPPESFRKSNKNKKAGI